MNKREGNVLTTQVKQQLSLSVSQQRYLHCKASAVHTYHPNLAIKQELTC